MTELLVDIDDPVATITLNRPETLNALTFPMLAAFREAVEAAERDARVVGIVVTGAGRGFCSGLDASVLQATTTTGSSSRVQTDEVPGLFTWLLGIDKPRSYAAGGSFALLRPDELATGSPLSPIRARDRRLAPCSKQRQTRRQSCWRRAAKLRPPQKQSSRKIDATEAFRIGLVQQVVEPDDLLAAARRYIVDLAENVSPASLADTKRLVYGQLGIGYEQALRETDEVQYAALDRVDAKEGAAALIDKRAPSFPRLGA